MVTYRSILTQNLREKATVFPAKVMREVPQDTMSMASGRTGKTGKTLRRAKMTREGSSTSNIGKSAFSQAGGHRKSMHQNSQSNASLNTTQEDVEDYQKTYNPSDLGQNYMTLFSTNYAYRLKTSSIFEDGKPYIFDVFIVHNDIKLAEFDLFNNLWKETLILSQLKDPKIQPVLSFGQLPEGIIYREIEEICGYSLDEYIKERQQSARIAINAHLRMESLDLPNVKSVPS